MKHPDILRDEAWCKKNDFRRHRGGLGKLSPRDRFRYKIDLVNCAWAENAPDEADLDALPGASIVRHLIGEVQEELSSLYWDHASGRIRNSAWRFDDRDSLILLAFLEPWCAWELEREAPPPTRRKAFRLWTAVLNACVECAPLEFKVHSALDDLVEFDDWPLRMFWLKDHLWSPEIQSQTSTTARDHLEYVTALFHLWTLAYRGPTSESAPLPLGPGSKRLVDTLFLYAEARPEIFFPAWRRVCRRGWSAMSAAYLGILAQGRSGIDGYAPVLDRIARGGEIPSSSFPSSRAIAHFAESVVQRAPRIPAGLSPQEARTLAWFQELRDTYTLPGSFDDASSELAATPLQGSLAFLPPFSDDFAMPSVILDPGRCQPVPSEERPSVAGAARTEIGRSLDDLLCFLLPEATEGASNVEHKGATAGQEAEARGTVAEGLFPRVRQLMSKGYAHASLGHTGDEIDVEVIGKCLLESEVTKILYVLAFWCRAAARDLQELVNQVDSQIEAVEESENAIDEAIERHEEAFHFIVSLANELLPYRPKLSGPAGLDPAISSPSLPVEDEADDEEREEEETNDDDDDVAEDAADPTALAVEDPEPRTSIPEQGSLGGETLRLNEMDPRALAPASGLPPLEWMWEQLDKFVYGMLRLIESRFEKCEDPFPATWSAARHQQILLYIAGGLQRRFTSTPLAWKAITEKDLPPFLRSTCLLYLHFRRDDYFACLRYVASRVDSLRSALLALLLPFGYLAPSDTRGFWTVLGRTGVIPGARMTGDHAIQLLGHYVSYRTFLDEGSHAFLQDAEMTPDSLHAEELAVDAADALNLRRRAYLSALTHFSPITDHLPPYLAQYCHGMQELTGVGLTLVPMGEVVVDCCAPHSPDPSDGLPPEESWLRIMSALVNLTEAVDGGGETLQEALLDDFHHHLVAGTAGTAAALIEVAGSTTAFETLLSRMQSDADESEIPSNVRSSILTKIESTRRFIAEGPTAAEQMLADDDVDTATLQEELEASIADRLDGIAVGSASEKRDASVDSETRAHIDGASDWSGATEIDLDPFGDDAEDLPEDLKEAIVDAHPWVRADLDFYRFAKSEMLALSQEVEHHQPRKNPVAGETVYTGSPESEEGGPTTAIASVASSPDAAASYHDRAQIFFASLEQMRTDDALTTARSLETIAQHDAEVSAGIGHLLESIASLRTGDWTGAIEKSRNAEQRGLGPALALSIQSVAYLRGNDSSEAMRAAQDALERAPDSAAAHIARALAHRARREYDAYNAEIEIALELYESASA